MPGNALPSSVLRRIMYHLRDDDSALEVCMHTCKSWYKCAELFLYVTVRLDCREALEEYQKKFQLCPYLLQHVRRLEINGFHSDETQAEQQEWQQETGVTDMLSEVSDDSSDNDEGWTWLFDALPLLAELTNLACLTFEFMTWTRLPVIVQQYFLVPRPNITDIILDQITFPDFRTFVLFLNKYSSLTSLHVTEVAWGDDVYFPPDDACLSSLRCLANVGTQITSSFSRLLLEKVRGNHLHSLKYGITFLRDLFFASQLHKFLGPFVENLEITLYIYSSDHAQSITMFLEPASFTNIHSLRLGMTVSDKDKGVASHFHRASVIISQIRSPNITDIVIHLVIQTREDVSRELHTGLGPIDDILQSSTFLSLRKVVIAPYFYPDTEQFESDELKNVFAQFYRNMLSRLFPKTAARGIVQFDDDSGWNVDMPEHTKTMQLQQLLNNY